VFDLVTMRSCGTVGDSKFIMAKQVSVSVFREGIALFGVFLHSLSIIPVEGKPCPAFATCQGRYFHRQFLFIPRSLAASLGMVNLPCNRRLIGAIKGVK
jgi:hypothetical protein